MWTTSHFRVTPVACALFALTTVRPVHAQDVPTVFIHGLASSGATWEGAADRLQARLSITPYRPNLIWRSTFESQGDGLQAQLGWLPASTVAVGHSNGGLVARQWSRLHPLNGIVTLGTPNQGAPLAYNALSWIWFDFNAGSVITDIFNAFGRDCCDWYWILSQVGDVADWVRYWLSLHPAAMASTLGIEFGAPVLGQMASDSPANLNSPDNLNREASVVPSRVGISVVAHNFYWAGPFRAIWPEWGDGVATVMYAASTGLNYWATYLWTTADPETPAPWISRMPFGTRRRGSRGSIQPGVTTSQSQAAVSVRPTTRSCRNGVKFTRPHSGYAFPMKARRIFRKPAKATTCFTPRSRTWWAYDHVVPRPVVAVAAPPLWPSASVPTTASSWWPKGAAEARSTPTATTSGLGKPSRFSISTAAL